VVRDSGPVSYNGGSVRAASGHRFPVPPDTELFAGVRNNHYRPLLLMSLIGFYQQLEKLAAAAALRDENNK